MKERISIVKNAAISSLGTYAEYALGLLTSVWIARSLGPTQFGEYAFVIWLCGWLIIASNNALTMSSIKFLAESRGRGDPDETSSIAKYLLRMQAVSSSVVLATFLGALLLWQPPEWNVTSKWVVPMIVIAVMTRAGFAMRVAIAKGFERFEPEAIAVIVSGILSVGMVFYASRTHQDFTAYILIYTIASVVLDLLVRTMVRRQLSKGSQIALNPVLLARIKSHLISSGIMILLLSMSARTIETLLLKSSSTAAVVGFFAISATLTKGAVDVLASGLSATLLPAMARSYGRAANARSQMLPDSIRYFAFLGFGLAAGGYLLAPAVIHLLYGLRYEGAIGATQISMLVAGISLLSAPINAYQTSSDLQGDRIRISAGALVVNLIIGVALVPRWGLVGALMTHAIARAAYLALAIIYLQLRSPIAFPTQAIFRMFAGGVLAFAAAVSIASFLDGIVAALAGAITLTVTYVGLTVVLRAWRMADYQLVGHLLSKIRVTGGLRSGVMRVAALCSSDGR